MNSKVFFLFFLQTKSTPQIDEQLIHGQTDSGSGDKEIVEIVSGESVPVSRYWQYTSLTTVCLQFKKNHLNENNKAERIKNICNNEKQLGCKIKKQKINGDEGPIYEVDTHNK